MRGEAAGEIVRKARVGQALDPAIVAGQAGIPLADLKAYEALVKPLSPETASGLARVLDLDPERLARIARGDYAPSPRGEETPSARVRQLVVTLPNGRTSNCYLFGFQDTEEAVIVDPGAEPERILAELEALAWRPRYAALTHGHPAHVGALAAILAEWALSVLVGPQDLALLPLDPSRCHAVRDGELLPLGRQAIRAVRTPGHTPGGVSYVADGGCFVGDSLLAGSLGEPAVPVSGYRILRERLATQILSLPPETRLYPGHGPVTTVAAERERNPFFSTGFIQSLNVP